MVKRKKENIRHGKLNIKQEEHTKNGGQLDE